MMNQQRTNVLGSTQFRNTPNIMDGITQPIAVSGVTINPPPLPPRRPISSYHSYNPFGSSYAGGYGYGSAWNGMGLGRYGNMGSYPGYSAYGQNHWGGPSGDVENRFVQYAEESTRPAFQSIETMVHTFSSVTMMMESTFFAMTSSFRAILGVAENMGKLRIMLRQLLSNFFLITFLKRLYVKVKCILGLKKYETATDLMWKQAITDTINENSDQTGTSSWPIFLFLSILFATPYLIHRLISNAKNININVNDPVEWLQIEEPIYTANALYCFTPASSEELPLKIGQKVWVAPESLQPKNLPGWCRVTDNINVGLVPLTYIKVVGQLIRKSKSSQSQALNFHQSTVINEDSSVVKENLESQEISVHDKDNDDNTFSKSNIDDNSFTKSKIDDNSFSKSKIENIFEMENKNH